MEDSISMAALTVARVKKKYYHRKTIILGVKTRSITQKVKNLPIVIFQQLHIRKYVGSMCTYGLGFQRISWNHIPLT